MQIQIVTIPHLPVTIKKNRPNVPKFNDKVKNNYDESKSDNSSDTIVYQNFDKLIKIDKNQVNLQQDKRRINFIIEELQKIMENLSDLLGEKSEIIFKQSAKLVQKEFLNQMKSKKYNSIATAIVIHSIRLYYLPITTKKIYDHLGCKDKQVKRILYILNKQYPIEPQCQIQSFFQQICQNMKFDDNFLKVCKIIHSILQQQNAIFGEHENVVAASIIKIAADVIFYEKSGIQLQKIALFANCCEFSIKNFFKKVNCQQIAMKLLQEYGIF